MLSCQFDLGHVSIPVIDVFFDEQEKSENKNQVCHRTIVSSARRVIAAGCCGSNVFFFLFFYVLLSDVAVKFRSVK